MSLSEAEELELLTLERERAMAGAGALPPGPSKGESYNRGIAQGASLGFADEITGAGATVADYLTGKNYDKKPLDLYREKRDVSRAKYGAAQREHPLVYESGGLTGGLATMALPGLGELNMAKMAALGAMAGYGGSQSEKPVDQLKDVAFGGTLGGVIGKATSPQVLGKAGDLAETGIKKVISSVFGPSEEAINARLTNNAAVKGAKSFTGVGEEMAGTADTLNKKIADLDTAAFETLSPEPDIPTKSILNEIENVKADFGKPLTSSDESALGKLGHVKQNIEGKEIPAKIPTTATKIAKGMRDNEIQKQDYLEQGDYIRNEDGETILSAQGGSLVDKMLENGDRFSIPTLEYNGLGGEVRRYREILPKNIFNKLFKKAEDSGATFDTAAGKYGVSDTDIMEALSKYKYKPKEGIKLGDFKDDAAQLLEQLKAETPALREGGWGDNISEYELKQMIRKLDKDIDWNDPNKTKLNEVYANLRVRFDDILKSKNQAYAEAIKPVAENIRSRDLFSKKFNLRKPAIGSEEGYTALDTTGLNVGKALKENKVETQGVLQDIQDKTGENYLNRIQNSEYARQFERPTTHGSRNAVTGASVGAAAGHFTGLPGGGYIGAAAGAMFGRQIDTQGGKMAADMIDHFVNNRAAYGKYGDILGAAMDRCPKAFAVTHFMLGSQDPNYQKMIDDIRENER